MICQLHCKPAALSKMFPLQRLLWIYFSDVRANDSLRLSQKSKDIQETSNYGKPAKSLFYF